jgi:transposase InsO family protein
MQLRAAMLGHEVLFDGKLKKYTGKKIHLDLKDNAHPIHCKPFPVPHTQAEVFKKECARLCAEDVLEPVGATEHAYPTFIIPKKDKTVRWVSDFRKLNSMLRRRVYPLPKIQDVLHRRPGYKYFTKIDLSMCYYTFELDEASRNLCVIVTPFGKFRYKRLPMGVSQAPDLCQEIMESIFNDMAEVEVFLDDIGIFSNDFVTHMRTIRKVLGRLQDNGFTVNPLKCEWAVQETDWLGYWLTPTGLKPWSKKIQAIQQLEPPRNVKQLRSFIGAVNYYRDMWPRRAHYLADLTTLTGKGKFEWTDKHQKAFERMKALLAVDCLLRYPDHNLPFHVYTDASDYQLGAVIMQADQPVAYFSRKLNAAQRNYTTIEKELLSVVEVLREFRTMLYGTDLTIFTDHKNLTYANLNTQRVLRWRLFIEEYGPTFAYVKGENNNVADFLSRLPFAEGKSAPGPYGPAHGYVESDPVESMFIFDKRDRERDVLSHHFYSSALDDEVVKDSFCASEVTLEAYLNIPQDDHRGMNPLDYESISAAQRRQVALWNLPELDPNRYVRQQFGRTELVCYRPAGEHNFFIMLPDGQVERTIRWYHQILQHAGMENLYSTMAKHYYYPGLKARVQRVVQSCEECQKYKAPGRGYGHLAPREARVAPWYEVAIDTIGPWEIPMQPGNNVLKFHALTMIDTVTNLTEIMRVRDTTAQSAATAFEVGWLFRYPRPVRVIHDQGTEFMGENFQAILRQWGIRNAPIGVRNPQANAICERMHQVVGNILRTILHTNPPPNAVAANALIDYALQTAAYAMKATTHRTLGVSPGALVYHRDMIMDLPFVADLLLLRNKRQQLIDYNLRRENYKRRNFDYQPGQWVLELTTNPGKLGQSTKGPYRIDRVHCNGTVSIRRTENIVDRVNIRHVRPYFVAEGNNHPQGPAEPH